jgi:hypothetical protein
VPAATERRAKAMEEVQNTGSIFLFTFMED